MQKWLYDVEVSPNFFCVTFLNVDTREDKAFVIFSDRNDSDGLESFLSEESLLIGFNNLHYDSLILRYVLENRYSESLLSDLFSFSSRIISADRLHRDVEVDAYKYATSLPHQLDLMKIMAFDKLGISLKQCAITLGWPVIQDLPFNYDHHVRNWDEAKLFLQYNMNDVLISERLYQTILPQIELREKLSDTFHVELRNASDSKMANVILEKFYSEELGRDMAEIRHLRTNREHFMLKDCIAPNIEFQTNYLKRIKREIADIAVRKLTGFKYSKKVEFGGITYDLGVGGLHSEDFPALFVSDDNFYIIEQDVASYYPSMMIVNKIIPAHLGDDFVKVLERITRERLAAKKTDKVKADGLKITINSIFGKLGSETFWLQDHKAMLSVTVSGQLYLLMLIEAFVLSGIEVISANTDGVVVRCPKELETKRQEVCRWWESKTGFVLEDTFYSTYSRSDVNNYITKKSNGETKAKGRFVPTVDIKKGYKHPIVPKAMYEYLANGIPLETTIKGCTNILDFCISQKAGSKFQMIFVHDGGEVEYLQKNNRFYVSNSGGRIVKKDKTKDNSEIGLYVGEKLQILNRYDESTEFWKYDVNYGFYVKEAEKYVSEIHPYNKEFAPFADEEPGEYREVDSKIREEILLFTHGMKNLSDKTLAGLIELKDKENEFTSFLDLLVYAEDMGFLASKYEDLISIGYFNKFGESSKLLEFLNEFRSGKNRYSSSHSDKTKEKRYLSLSELWNSLLPKNISPREVLENEMKVLGRMQSTFDISRRWGYVTSVEVITYSDGNVGAPKATIYMLATGKTGTIKVNKKEFSKKKFSDGDFVYCYEFEKRPRWKKTEVGFEEIPNSEEWWLKEYEKKSDSELSREIATIAR